MPNFPQNILFTLERTKEVEEAIAARRGFAHSAIILDTAITILKIHYIISLSLKGIPESSETVKQFVKSDLHQDIVSSLMACLAYGIIGPSTLDCKNRPDVQRDLETLSNDVQSLIKAMHVN